MVQDVTGQLVTVVDRPRRSGDSAELVADAQMSRELLDWTPAHSDLRTIINTAWLWYQKRFL
jgi:UDP-glucose 4-epimerase